MTSDEIDAHVKYGRFAKSPLAAHGVAQWVEDFDKRTNPMGRDYYWLSGEFVNEDQGEDTDEWALANGYVSVVPVQFDLTAHHFIEKLNDWKFND